jgi:hypothetical protein
MGFGDCRFWQFGSWQLTDLEVGSLEVGQLTDLEVGPLDRWQLI